VLSSGSSRFNKKQTHAAELPQQNKVRVTKGRYCPVTMHTSDNPYSKLTQPERRHTDMLLCIYCFSVSVVVTRQDGYNGVHERGLVFFISKAVMKLVTNVMTVSGSSHS
jgi:hypothetical protein